MHDMWQITHMKNDGTWVNEKAQQVDVCNLLFICYTVKPYDLIFTFGNEFYLIVAKELVHKLCVIFNIVGLCHNSNGRI